MNFGLNTAPIGQDKKVLITGHTGFKGTWLTLLLQTFGMEVCGLSLPAEENSLYSRLARSGAIQEHFVDIRNHEAVSTSLSELRPSIIFHLAAQPLVLKSYSKPRETFETNVMGTVNLLDCAFDLSSTEIISVVTTDKVYRNGNEPVRFKESDALEGKDPYSASKVGTEAAVSAWQQMRKLKNGPLVISLRAGNVIGGGDFAENRLLPDLVRGFSKGRPVEIRNPNSTRPWEHVLDPLYGYVKATGNALAGNGESTYNFAPNGSSLSVGEVAQISQKTWGRGATVLTSETSDDFEAITLELDSSRSRDVLKWVPAWSQENAIIATIDWWKKVLSEKASPAEACASDLEYLFRSIQQNSNDSK